MVKGYLGVYGFTIILGYMVWGFGLSWGIWGLQYGGYIAIRYVIKLCRVWGYYYPDHGEADAK